ncbi:MAG: TetR/AcrR family transcriptional regulator [Gemmatimonadaceae bacterium]|nr:TetR/AcrR family transcriptional regulator [Gemmatimonadaceae bacterium]
MPDNRRAAILAAALAEFDVKGLYGARMDDIALAAGLSKGSIYRYFPDKNRLFAETIRATLNDTIARGGGGAQHDRQLFLRWIWKVASEPRFQAAYRLSLTQDPALGDITHDMTILIENAFAKPLATLLGQTERESHLPEDSAQIRARLTISTLLGAALMGANTPFFLDSGVAFLLRACELDAQSPQADGY